MHKTAQSQKLKKISYALALSLLVFTNASASTITNTDKIPESESMYKYGALESNIPFAVLASNTELGNISAENKVSNTLNDGALSSNASPFDTYNRDLFEKELEDTIDKQAFSVETLETTMNNINRNNHGFKTFLLGTNLGILKFQLAQIKDQAALLKKMSKETQDAADQALITEHQKILIEEQGKVEDFLFQQENRFSLFGWIINIL
ncbi:MAG: hypothetical protein ABIS26_00965 [Candidatus Paceibacterota bacterium]